MMIEMHEVKQYVSKHRQALPANHLSSGLSSARRRWKERLSVYVLAVLPPPKVQCAGFDSNHSLQSGSIHREIEILKQVSHKNVIPLLDVIHRRTSRGKLATIVLFPGSHTFRTSRIHARVPKDRAGPGPVLEGSIGGDAESFDSVSYAPAPPRLGTLAWSKFEEDL